VVHVIATIEVQPGKRDAFLDAFAQFQPRVLAEPGCIEYGATADAQGDIGRPVPYRENVITLVERWESPEALRAHLLPENMAPWKAAVKDLVAGVTLQVLEPLDQ
jgi:quinol monooxygenase YgiN